MNWELKMNIKGVESMSVMIGDEQLDIVVIRHGSAQPQVTLLVDGQRRDTVYYFLALARELAKLQASR